jgi:CRP-like cAMP-binding protein
MSDTARPTNRLLAALPKKEYSQLLARLELVPLIYNDDIYETGDVIRHVYFPESGIISLLSRVERDSSIEVGIVGSEGMAGLPVFLGIKTSANVAVVQGAGFANKMTARDFLYSCKDGNKLPTYLHLFMHSLMMQISQSAACNRFHPIEARLSRWLLMTQDRMSLDEFQITQEFLSNMLGVRREAVNKAAGDLQRRDLISYSRGNLRVNDRLGLEKAACTCYGIIKKGYDEAV